MVCPAGGGFGVPLVGLPASTACESVAELAAPPPFRGYENGGWQTLGPAAAPVVGGVAATLAASLEIGALVATGTGGATHVQLAGQSVSATQLVALGWQ